MEKKIEFKSGKNILRGSLFVPIGNGPFPGIIFFHGNGGSGEKYFEAGNFLMEKGIMSMAFNYTGCGRSDGNYLTQTLNDALVDAVNAYEFFLRQEKLDKKRIGMVGGSFGGFVASMLLPKVNIKSLVLLSSSAHDDTLDTKIDMGPIEEEIKYFSDKKKWENSKSYENVKVFKGYVLVIKSEFDENVPAEVVDRYFDVAQNASNKMLQVIKAADHRLSSPEMRNEFFRLISDWFLKTL